MSDKTNERGEPDEIWLQIHGDANPADYPDGPLPDLRGDDVTWCWEPIFEHDVKYVRADIVAALAEPADSVGREAVAINYALVHRFSVENSVDYNALSRLIRRCTYGLTAALTQPSQPFTFQGIPIVENPDMAPDEVRVFNRPSQPGEEVE